MSTTVVLSIVSSGETVEKTKHKSGLFLYIPSIVHVQNVSAKTPRIHTFEVIMLDQLSDEILVRIMGWLLLDDPAIEKTLSVLPRVLSLLVPHILDGKSTNNQRFWDSSGPE